MRHYVLTVNPVSDNRQSTVGTYLMPIYDQKIVWNRQQMVAYTLICTLQNTMELFNNGNNFGLSVLILNNITDLHNILYLKILNLTNRLSTQIKIKTNAYVGIQQK